MIGLEHRFRPLHLIDIGHHREDVAGAGGLDGVGKSGERADVNHGGPFASVDYRPAREAVKAAFKRSDRFKPRRLRLQCLEPARNRFSALAAVHGVR